MVKLADTIDLGSIAFGMQVQVLSGAPTFCRANMRGKISDFPRPPLSGAVVLLSNSGFISYVKSTAKMENLVHHYRFRVYLLSMFGIRKVLPREHARENLVHHYRFRVYLFDSAGTYAATGFTLIFLTAPEYVLQQVSHLSSFNAIM